MSATYYLILTAYGAQRIAQLQADQSSAPLAVNFVAGDANGQPYLPQTRIAATGLIHQRVSVPLQSVDVVDDDTCQAVAVLDATVGGFHIHEIGITDATGQLVYIGNYHGGYKPVLSEGAGGDLTVVLDLVASGIGTVIISPDPSFIYAGQEWVDANFVRIPTFNAHVDQYNSHVTQNNLEHANLLALIAANASSTIDLLLDQSQQLNNRIDSLVSFLNSYFCRRNDGVYRPGQYILTLAPGFEMTITLVGGGGSGGSLRSYAHDFSGDMNANFGNEGEDTTIQLTDHGWIARAKGGLGGGGAYGTIEDGDYTAIFTPTAVGGRGTSFSPSSAVALSVLTDDIGVGGPIGADGNASETDVSGGVGYTLVDGSYGGGSAGLIANIGEQTVYSGGGSAAGIITVSITNTSIDPKTLLLKVGRGGRGVTATFDGISFSTFDAQDGIALIQSNQLNILT